MALEFYIAGRIIKNSPAGGGISGVIVRIAAGAIALSTAVMIVAFAVVNGFQEEVRAKMFGFWGHIHITHYDLNMSYEVTSPVSTEYAFYQKPDTAGNIRHIQVFATKAGIVKSGGQIEGIVLKGVGKDYDWGFLEERLEGRNLNMQSGVPSGDILFSRSIASRLNLKVGDSVIVYFIQQPPRARKLHVSGIYKTGLEEYDKLYCLVDIRQVQALNNWGATQVGGFEVIVRDVELLDRTASELYEEIPQEMVTQTLAEINPNIFDWLGMQTLNKWVILVLMVLVAGINITTVLLILILERSRMIGVLKALGAGSASVRKIFLATALLITGIGMAAGNIAGIGLCLMQKYTGFFSLSEASYYVSKVPVQLNWGAFLVIDAGTLLVCLLILILPSHLISKITPVKAIRFD